MQPNRPATVYFVANNKLNNIDNKKEKALNVLGRIILRALISLQQSKINISPEKKDTANFNYRPASQSNSDSTESLLAHYVY